jgi:peroxiredoxin
LSDRDRRVALAYGAAKSAKDRFAARYTFVIGPDRRIVEAIDTTDPAGQAAELLGRV